MNFLDFLPGPAWSSRSVGALEQLQIGHRRFVEQNPAAHSYDVAAINAAAHDQKPIAAIIGCSDSRVSPEILFDQSLGKVFASRVPANVASDSAKWMLEIAVTELSVPLVIVLGHRGCMAVGQILAGKSVGSGGMMRADVLTAIQRAKLAGDENLYERSVAENVGLTIEHLKRDSYPLQDALAANRVAVMGIVYDMFSGEMTVFERP